MFVYGQAVHLDSIENSSKIWWYGAAFYPGLFAGTGAQSWIYVGQIDVALQLEHDECVTIVIPQVEIELSLDLQSTYYFVTGWEYVGEIEVGLTPEHDLNVVLDYPGEIEISVTPCSSPIFSLQPEGELVIQVSPVSLYTTNVFPKRDIMSVLCITVGQEVWASFGMGFWEVNVECPLALRVGVAADTKSVLGLRTSYIQDLSGSMALLLESGIKADILSRYKVGISSRLLSREFKVEDQ